MPTYQLNLEGFSFPRKLPNKKANFRLVTDVRIVTDRKQFKTLNAVLPSFDTFWECDTNRSKKPNYVRGLNTGKESNFNMDRIDSWDRLILIFSARRIFSVQFKVIDVNRKDGWDQVRDFLSPTVHAVFGRMRETISPELPLALPDSLGNAADDVRSFILKKLAGGDKVLFRGSGAPKEPASIEVVQEEIRGRGTAGGYSIRYSLRSL